ncbi:MAG: hypothetical protein AAGD00_05085 [Planctomycetota bacterium]
MLRTLLLISLLAITASLLRADSAPDLPDPRPMPGDPEKGRAYLLHGGYIGAGIPMPLWRLLHAGQTFEAPILREGVDPTVPMDMNQFVTHEGVEVASGINCLGCHASMFMGEFVVGMGNSRRDFTGEADLTALKALAGVMVPSGSPARTNMERFFRGADALAGRSSAPFRGVNPAFRFEELAAAQRNPHDLTWSEEPVFDVLPYTVASDVPAWWNVKKKSRLYYNGMGVGDFAKLLQQIGIVMIEDAEHAASITPHMRDLLAYIDTLEPPKYPGTIDTRLASIGERVFNDNCMSCHGTYGDDWTYPNKVVPVEKVGTDPLYARALKESGLVDWYTSSWFAKDGPKSYSEPMLGYIAPPLDGVWATSPYFHNGSVPTIEAVLDSSKRPERWRRSFRHDDYDLHAMGWNYEVVKEADHPHVYDTTLPGYGNQGHTFGDDLTPDERRALMEYLKTL